MKLTSNGKSDYRIVISKNASISEKHAANELQEFLQQISGAKLPIVLDKIKKKPKEIILGNNKHLAQFDINIDFDKLGDEGFSIKTVNDSIVIAGGRLRGTIYGVYTFLEDYLGCHWFSSKVSHIPKNELIEIGPIDDTQVPMLEYREIYYFDAFDGDWAVRNKVNGNFARLDEHHGSKVKYSHFVHTFFSLLLPKEYFNKHPEYYSEINGKRTAGRSQLCLTNPDVLRLAIEKVKQWIKEVPDATIFSVSQNDGSGACECKLCAALDEREGSHSATMLNFVNQIAEAIEKDYPNVGIDTLAYRYTRKPPRTIRPRSNVIVRLCSIECCFSHPIESCEKNIFFKDDIRGWSKISDRLYIWDYVTNFHHYIQPFPNLYVLKPNIQFFINYGVKGIFEEGNYASGGGGEFAELRAYILAKLLWNSECNTDAIIDEFLKGYYGKAADPLGEYINMLSKKVKGKNIHINIYSKPDSKFFSEKIIKQATDMFDQAERLAADEVLHRVQVARLPIQYVKLETNAVKGDERKKITDRFFSVAEKEGITQIREGHPILEFQKQV